MKILVTGANGQLGYDVIKVLEQRHVFYKGVDASDFDITDAKAVDKYIVDYQPSAVIHCAAYTAVDRAEDEAERCTDINANGTRNVAQSCKKVGAKMMYISTDYVFLGETVQAYKTDDETNPQSVYGKTKLQGERAVQEILNNWFIVRISWVFGKNGSNFVTTMLKLGKEKSELSVVADQIGSPTYTADLAVVLCDMIATEKYGIYHATNEGYCTWAEFAEEIMSKAELPCKIKAISTSEYPTKSKRPLNSKLNKSCLDKNGFNRLPDWKDALDRYIKEIL